MSRKIIFIIGAHRSGTSLCAKVLGGCEGYELPSSARSGPDNPKGFYEPFFVKEYHDKLLSQFGLTWDTFLPHRIDFPIIESSGIVSELVSLVNNDYPGGGDIILKDPRIVHFLPLWEKVSTMMKLEKHFVVPVRCPSAVAESLAKRNSTSVSRSLLIWASSVIESEKNTRGESRSFVEFPNWASDVPTAISRIGFDLGVNFRICEPDDALTAFDPSLVHHHTSVFRDGRAGLLSLCNDIYGACKELGESPNEISLMEAMDDYGLRLDDFIGLAEDLLDEASASNELVRNELASDNQQLASDNQQLASDNQQLASDNQQLVDTVSLQASSLTALSASYSDIQLKYEGERLTVWRPCLRNIYRLGGRLCRKFLTDKALGWLKRFLPSPEGVPARLAYPVGLSMAKDHLLFEDIAESGEKPDVIVLSIINWAFRTQRPQHIARELSNRDRRVFYMEMESANGETCVTKIAENLFVTRLSKLKSGDVQTYTGNASAGCVKEWVDTLLSFCESIGASSHKQIIIQHPFWWQYAQHLPAEFEIVFDCMDDISGFSNTSSETLDLERDLLSNCDKLIVSSQYLFDKYKGLKAPRLIRNATELTPFFADISEKPQPIFVESEGDAKVIRVGYVGAIAEWFDVDIIRESAQANKDFEFHLCGEVTAKEASALSDLENVKMYGEISYGDVPGFHSSMDVMIIPFKIVPIILACDPVKFYEYSASGKPTVSTRLPELERSSELVYFGSSPKEFSEQIRLAASRGRDPEAALALKDYAKMNTWGRRADDFSDALACSPMVSVIILSYGSSDFTKAAIFSLFDGGQTYPNLEVLVVDNGSGDEIISELEQMVSEHANVRIISNGSNLGFAAGNNVGIKAAKGEYVLLLNNDTYVAPGAIMAMVNQLSNNPSIGVVGPLTNNIGNEAKLDVKYSDMLQMKKVACQATRGYRGQHTPLPVVAYFAAMFRQSDFEKFGLLSTDYGRGMFEDDDHCAKIRSLGYECALAEDAFVHHHLSGTFSQIDDKERADLFEKNKATFESKWGVWSPHKYRTSRPSASKE